LIIIIAAIVGVVVLAILILLVVLVVRSYRLKNANVQVLQEGGASSTQLELEVRN
jgi:flagellar biosynthesis/type III secretory pathway M-ring protein FliF/YscJ